MTIKTNKHARVANTHSNDRSNHGAITIGMDAVNDSHFAFIEGKVTAPVTCFLNKRPKHDTLFIEVRGVTNARFNQYHRDVFEKQPKAKYNLLYKHVVSSSWMSKKLDENNIDQKVLGVLQGDFDRKSHFYIVKLNGTRWCDIQPFQGTAEEIYQLSRHYLKTTYCFSRMHLLSERINVCTRDYFQSQKGMLDMRLYQTGKDKIIDAPPLSEEDALRCCNRLIAHRNSRDANPDLDQPVTVEKSSKRASTKKACGGY